MNLNIVQTQKSVNKIFRLGSIVVVAEFARWRCRFLEPPSLPSLVLAIAIFCLSLSGVFSDDGVKRTCNRCSICLWPNENEQRVFAVITPHAWQQLDKYKNGVINLQRTIHCNAHATLKLDSFKCRFPFLFRCCAHLHPHYLLFIGHGLEFNVSRQQPTGSRSNQLRFWWIICIDSSVGTRMSRSMWHNDVTVVPVSRSHMPNGHPFASSGKRYANPIWNISTTKGGTISSCGLARDAQLVLFLVIR